MTLLASISAVADPAVADGPPDRMKVTRDGQEYECRELPQEYVAPPPSPVSPDGAQAAPRSPICPDGFGPEPLRSQGGPRKGPPPKRDRTADAPAYPISRYCPQGVNGCYSYAVQTRREPSSSTVYAMTGHQSQEKPYVDPFGHSIGQLWAIDDDDNTRPYSTIEVGWRMTRGAPAPQLFVFRFDNGNETCYVGQCGSPATDCWQPASGAVEVPGNYLGYADVYHQYSINAGSNGSWWVGHDNNWLGYYIGTSEGGVNCWQRRPDNLNRIDYGGEIFSSASSPTFNAPCTDMGNGQPGGSGVAARFNLTWRSVPNASYYNNDADQFHVEPYSLGYFHTDNTGDFRYGGGGSCGTFNRPPTARLAFAPSEGSTSTSFYADLAASSDPDGDSLTYKIDWGDGSTTTAMSSSHRYSRGGTYTVVGTVRDSFGGVHSTYRTVEVNEPYPSVVVVLDR